MILHSQWRTRKEDFRGVICLVLKTHLTVSAFRQEDRRRPTSQRNTSTLCRLLIIKGCQRRGQLTLHKRAQENLLCELVLRAKWIYFHWTTPELETSPLRSPVSQSGEVREEEGGRSSEILVQVHVSRSRQKHSPLFQDQLFICMRFPVCLGRTRRAVVAQLQTVAQCTVRQELKEQKTGGQEE